VSTIKELHRDAMERTDLALAAQRVGDHQEGQLLLRAAYELEAQAAHLATQRDDSEPTPFFIGAPHRLPSIVV
jgi:hypothetical protein